MSGGGAEHPQTASQLTGLLITVITVIAAPKGARERGRPRVLEGITVKCRNYRNYGAGTSRNREKTTGGDAGFYWGAGGTGTEGWNACVGVPGVGEG